MSERRSTFKVLNLSENEFIPRFKLAAGDLNVAYILQVKN